MLLNKTVSKLVLDRRPCTELSPEVLLPATSVQFDNGLLASVLLRLPWPCRFSLLAQAWMEFVEPSGRPYYYCFLRQRQREREYEAPQLKPTTMLGLPVRPIALWTRKSPFSHGVGVT